MDREEQFIRELAKALSEHGQAATQFVTASLDGKISGLPDVVFAPDVASGRVVCVEFKSSAAPTLSPITIAEVVRHRDAIVEANEGVVFVLATDAKLLGKGAEIAEQAKLVTLQLDWNDPAALALAIKIVATP